MSALAETLPSPADLRPFQEPSLRGSLWQLANSVIPFFALWALMVQTVRFSYPLTLVLAVLASGFLVRVFMIFHDCGHGSFFRSRKANEWVGFFTGVLTMTPFREWWHTHALHHAQTGNLDKRGSGDVWTLTVDEFRDASRTRKLLYVLVRQPQFMLTVGPLLVFGFQNRFSSSTSRLRERCGEREFRLPTAPDPSVAFGKHRAPPRASLEPEDPELQTGGLPPGISRPLRCAAVDLPAEPELAAPALVGSGYEGSCGLASGSVTPTPERTPERWRA